MDYFVFSKAENRLVNIPVIEEFEFIEEFGHERYIDIKSTSLAMHYHKGIEICFIKKGKYKWTINSDEYTLLPGNGFITCPWQLHGNNKGEIDLGEIWWLIVVPKYFESDGSFTLSDWTILSEAIQNEIGETFALNNNPVIKKSNEIYRLFEQLYYELTAKDIGYNFAIRNIIETLLLTITRLIKNRIDKNDTDSDWLANFENLIKGDIANKWKLDELAQLLGMGTTSLNDKVKKLSGYSPSSYILNLRIEEAKRLLVSSTQPITEIGLACGFYSSQHFSTTFLHRTGTTPTQYRKSN